MMVEYARMNLVIPTTGDPKILDPLLESVIANTVGSYTVTILMQQTEHGLAQRTYRKWRELKPHWRFLHGTDNMILSARNLGMLENFLPWNPDEPEQFFAEMDDDIILPPGWDEDIVKAAKTKPYGALFVPLMTFKSDMNYKDQVVAVPEEIWKALANGDVATISKYYTLNMRTTEPAMKMCGMPEYSFIVRRGKYLLQTLWDTAFDVVRNASRANEDIMLQLKKLNLEAWVVRSVAIFHYGYARDANHPLRHFSAHTLNDHLYKKWPEYNNSIIKEYVHVKGDNVKLEMAKANMVKEPPEEALVTFKNGGE